MTISIRESKCHKELSKEIHVMILSLNIRNQVQP